MIIFNPGSVGFDARQAAKKNIAGAESRIAERQAMADAQAEAGDTRLRDSLIRRKNRLRDTQRDLSGQMRTLHSFSDGTFAAIGNKHPLADGGPALTELLTRPSVDRGLPEFGTGPSVFDQVIRPQANASNRENLLRLLNRKK